MSAIDDQLQSAPAESRPRRSGRVLRVARRVLAVLGLVLLAVFLVLAWRILRVPQEKSWPPPASAVTAAGAQQAAQAFAARSTPHIRDLAVPYAWSTAATVEPWPEGKSFFPKIEADIEAARSSVHILMFGWREGEIGRQMAALLERKLQQGVEVRVVVDAAGSKPYGPANAMFTKLADAGAQIVVNNTLPVGRRGLFPLHEAFDWTQDELGHADHRKLYVIDGKVAWTGGAGIEDHFWNGGFHDVMARVTGDVVRQAQALFLMAFRAQGGPLPNDLSTYFPEPADPGTIPVALLQTVPGGFQSATQAMRQLIDTAKTRIDIMNPYFTDADIIQRVAAAARRGVKVRIVVSAASNNAQATAAFRHHYPELQRAGAEIYEYPGAVVHAKILVADDTVVFGTVNLDAWALYRNLEIAMMARSPETVSLFEQRVFGPDIAKSHIGKPAHGLVGRFKAWLWDELSYFL